MERGANTFPFHNLLPYSESKQGLFLFFSPSINWIKEKSVVTLAIRNICDKKQNKFQSQFSHHITAFIHIQNNKPAKNNDQSKVEKYCAFVRKASIKLCILTQMIHKHMH